MVRKLFTVVCGDGVNNRLKGKEQRNSSLGDVFRTLTINLGGHGEVSTDRKEQNFLPDQ